MHATTTRCFKLYIRGGADRQLLSRLLADRARGIGYSETLRRALRVYYHLDDRPTPPPPNGGTDPAVARATLLLAGQVRDLADEVVRLQAEVNALRAELRAAIVG